MNLPHDIKNISGLIISSRQSKVYFLDQVLGALVIIPNFDVID